MCGRDLIYFIVLINYEFTLCCGWILKTAEGAVVLIWRARRLTDKKERGCQAGPRRF